MKKYYSLLLAYLLQDVLNRRLLFKQTDGNAFQKPSPIILPTFLELGKLSMQPKFVAAQKMLFKQKPSKHS